MDLADEGTNGEEGIEYSGNISAYKVFLVVVDGIQIPGEGGHTHPLSTSILEGVEKMGAHSGKFGDLHQDVEVVITSRFIFPVR